MPNNNNQKNDKNQPKKNAEQPNVRRDLGKMDQETSRSTSPDGEQNYPSRPTTRLPPDAPLQS